MDPSDLPRDEQDLSRLPRREEMPVYPNTGIHSVLPPSMLAPLELPLVYVVPATPSDRIQHCAELLMEEAGRTEKEVGKLPALYLRASRDKSLEFMQYALAVMYVESRFNRDAVSPKDARGLMQMTAIAVEESVDKCRLPPIEQDTLHDSYTNVKYGTCYLKLMYIVARENWDEALILYNGGYMQLQKYRRGERMAEETANYVLLVNRARNICVDRNTVDIPQN